MNALPRRERISVEDYLAGELQSEVKHEYLDGYVYSMAGAKNKHNRLGARIIIALGRELAGSPCEVYTSDTKIFVENPTPPRKRFYYPDVVVVCEPSDDELSYQEKPTLIVEVVSESTRRIDEYEKLYAYTSLVSLEAYLIVETDAPVVYLHRRKGDEFEYELYEGRGAVIDLPEIGATLSLAELYPEKS
jgi:Uma2 family endonuclease